MIKAMAWQEIKKRYAGTLGGFVWSVINPLMMILVFWFVFSVGFKIKPLGSVPFIVVFCCGMIPWATFSEFLGMSTNAIVGVPHLTKKTVFPTEILPVVHLMAGVITHSIMLVVLIIMLFLYRVPFSFWNLQFLYYLFALSVFSLGLGWFLSAVNVFYRDVGHMIGVVLNMWFWLTPVVWQSKMMPATYQSLIKLNPLYYIVEGYRASFIYHTPFWHTPMLGIYFWLVCVSCFIIGGIVFKRLKPEFAEVL